MTPLQSEMQYALMTAENEERAGYKFLLLSKPAVPS